MKTAVLAKAIERDLLRERTSETTACSCFSCGRSFMPRRLEDAVDNARFCSVRCREWYDAGNRAYDPGCASKANPRWCSLPMGKHGFLVPCANCGKVFDSRGLRCCSTKCERGLGEKQEISRLKAEAGVEFESRLGPKRKCQHCGGDIAKYQGIGKARRLTRSDAKFCSPKCREGAKKAQQNSGFLEPDRAQTSPEAISSHFGPNTLPQNVIGGHRFGGPGIDRELLAYVVGIEMGAGRDAAKHDSAP